MGEYLLPLEILDQRIEPRVLGNDVEECGRFSSGQRAEVIGDVKIQGKRWAVLTGAIPMYKQQSLYFEHLGSTTATVRDEDYVEYFRRSGGV